MSILLSPTREAVKVKPAPKLTDFPALVLAATKTTAPLEPLSAEYAAVQAALEALSRLRLSVNATYALMLLAQRGALRMGVLTRLLHVTTAAGTGLMQRLQHLGLVTARRRDSHGEDRREITVTITEAGRRVISSVVALSAMGAAAMTVAARLRRKPGEAEPFSFEG